LDVGREEKLAAKLSKEIETLNNHECHTCGQPFHDRKHQQVMEAKQSELNAARASGTEHSALLSELETAHTALGTLGKPPKMFYDRESDAIQHQATLSNLEKQIAEKSTEVDPYGEQITEMQQQALQEVTYDALNDLTRLQEHQEFLLKLLTSKDSFIRKKIIDQNLAYLNNRLTYYLDKMGLPHTVTFLNDLTVEIMQLGQDLDFDNLSRGERNRLILSLSWAFRDVWESLYQSINLLFIDELIDNGLDASGVESALAVLKKIARERKKNVFLISHKDELIGRVNNVLKVIKENGFTSYANDLEVTE
jgi:energy-coupling factor transporter ATP-binding protein EcfA2